MSAPIVAFMSLAGGVGNTTLVYHLACMFADLGLRVVAADFDPQATLTSMMVSEERLAKLWRADTPTKTVKAGILQRSFDAGDAQPPHLEIVEEYAGLIGERLAMLPGDIGLAWLEPCLAQMWHDNVSKGAEWFLPVAPAHLLFSASDAHRADIVLVDMGPTLSALNGTALAAAKYVVFPVAPDILSVRGMQAMGPMLRRWRCDWQRLQDAHRDLLSTPVSMDPLGYVFMRRPARIDRPVHGYEQWLAEIPDTYHVDVLDLPTGPDVTVVDDPECLGVVNHYPSLAELAQEAHKPMFALKPADGAFGGHEQAVLDAYWSFKGLAETIASRISIAIPQP